VFSQIKKTGKETLIYGITGVLISSVGFFLLPVYTRYLTPADYGVLEILDITTRILSMFLVLGITSGMFRSFFTEEKQREGYRNTVVSTTFNFSLSYHLIVFACLIPFLGPISNTLIGNTQKRLVLFALAAMVFVNISDINMRLYRLREEALKYASRDIAIFLLMVILNILFIAFLKRGVLGILESRVISYFLLCIISLPVLLIYLKPRCSLSELRSQLSFGLPFVPMNLAGWILLLSDRYFLRFYSDLTEVGLYSLGCKFGLIVTILISEPFFLSWGPRMYMIEKERMAPHIYSRTLTYFFSIGIFLCLTLSLFCKEAIIFITTPAFYESYKIVPIVCFALLLGGMQRIITVGFYLKRKTRYFPVTYGTAAIINIILNYLLVPSMGMMGAAIATLISYITLTILNVCFSNHFYSIPYEKRGLAKIFVTAFLLYLVSIPLSLNNQFFLLVIKCLLLIAFPAIFYFSGVLYPDEIAGLRSFFTSKLLRIKSV